MKYSDFIEKKTQSKRPSGKPAIFYPDQMFDFQRFITEWALRQGRAAIFGDCGLGKTIMFLTWAQNIVIQENKPVLVIAPLAVTRQIITEAEKFGIEAHRSRDGSVAGDITVTNYEKRHLFNFNEYVGVVCDESSCIKSNSSKTRIEITEFLRKIPYRLLCTATAAPNDYLELGTSSEALGYLGFQDMLGRFFKNDNNNTAMRRMYGEAPKWRFRGHAELPFWRWVCSWARAFRKPSDIGFSDDRFVLPPLIKKDHLVESRTLPPGMLFSVPASTLPEQREERKRTIKERCEKVAGLVDHEGSSLIWCHYDKEADYLEKIIPGSVQISGRDSDDKKEDKFMGFVDGDIKKLITKPKIGAWGLNFQHCNHVVTFPSHSYEQLYQGIRRCWRFGQKNAVTVDTVFTEGERKVMDNVKRKENQADIMFSNLVEHMINAESIEKSNHQNINIEVPAWLKAI